MTVAYRTGATGQANATSLTTTIPAPAVAGDVAIAVMSNGSTSDNVTAPPGWTQYGSTLTTQSQLTKTFYKVLTSGDIGVAQTWTRSALGKFVVVIQVYSGVDTANPIGGSSQVGYANTTATARLTPTYAYTGRSIEWAATRGADPGPWTIPATHGNAVQVNQAGTGAGTLVVADSTSDLDGNNTFTSSSQPQASTGGVWLNPGTPPPPAAGTVNRLWQGALTADGFSVTAKTGGATSLVLEVATDSAFTAPVGTFGPIVPNATGYATFAATGLAADTRYYYRVSDTPTGGSSTVISEVGRARTKPGAAVVPSFSFAVSSCVTTNATDAVALESIRAWDPLFMVHVGDFHYMSSESTDPAVHAANWESQISGVSQYGPMLRDVPTYYTFSDHEAGGDNADAGAWTQPVHDAYAYATPHAPFLDTRSPAVTLDQSWSVGRVGFYLLDDRSAERSPGGATDDASKTMLGAAQKARLKAWLTDGQQPLKVIIGDQPWMGAFTANKLDAWWSYGTERQELIDYIAANNVNVVMAHGDAHTLGYTPGASNSWGGFPVFCCSQLAQVGGGYNLSTFTEMYNTTNTVRGSQYMRFTVADDGTTITLTASGWDAITETEKISGTHTVSTIAPPLVTVWDGAAELPATLSVVGSGVEVPVIGVGVT